MTLQQRQLGFFHQYLLFALIQLTWRTRPVVAYELDPDNSILAPSARDFANNAITSIDDDSDDEDDDDNNDYNRNDKKAFINNSGNKNDDNSNGSNDGASNDSIGVPGDGVVGLETSASTTRTTAATPRKATRMGAASSFRTALLCTQTHMTIIIAAPKHFTGYVYTEGYFHDPECKFAMDTKLSISIPYNRCGTDETADAYSNVIIVQKHPKMMTAADEIYHVVCDKNKLQSSDVELRLESGFEMANDAAEAARNVYTDLSVKNRSRSKILELYA